MRRSRLLAKRDSPSSRSLIPRRQHSRPTPTTGNTHPGECSGTIFREAQIEGIRSSRPPESRQPAATSPSLPRWKAAAVLTPWTPSTSTPSRMPPKRSAMTELLVVVSDRRIMGETRHDRIELWRLELLPASNPSCSAGGQRLHLSPTNTLALLAAVEQDFPGTIHLVPPDRAHVILHDYQFSCILLLL